MTTEEIHERLQSLDDLSSVPDIIPILEHMNNKIAELESGLQSVLQRAVNAEMELLALKSPQIPPDVRARMDADRKRAENHQPEWLNQALNEGDGTYKP